MWSDDASARKRAVAVGAVGVGLMLAGCSDDGTEKPATARSATSHQSVTVKGKTSCSRLFYIGDSISVGLVSPIQLPQASDRLQAQLARVGVTSPRIDVSGGRATFEEFENRPSTLDVLAPAITKKFTGCYFLALGTNDAGNVAAGADAGVRTRIDTIMARIGKQPVVWPTLATNITGKSPYAQEHMKAFNAELVAATKRYPNLRVYDWASERNAQLAEADGIHDRRLGSRERAIMYAHALAVAFPVQGGSPAVIGSVAGKAPSTQNAPHLPHEAGDDETFWAADTATLTHFTSGTP